jgi:1,4-alpha-glucan branching enzyme
VSSRRPGALALVLHSHMPYVEGFGTWPFGEEWLWEAVACVYLPLLELIDGAPITVGLTPVLCDQLEAMRGEPGERYLRFLREIRAVIHAEDAAGLERGGELDLAAEVRRAAVDYVFAEEAFERRGRDLLRAFDELDRVELWTSSATHALLPMLATDAGLRLQLATGTASHLRRFGDWGGGFWLPECAYVPGLERDLADHGVRTFCVDQTGVPGFDHLRPVTTEAGPVAVPIDWPTVELVWNDRDGYPVHGAYRDYHRRTVHDLKPWSNAGQPYDREVALALARDHARDFVERASRRVADGGLLCCAIDTELLGHWWYEGPVWLAAVLEEAPRQGLDLVTVSEGIERSEAQRVPLAPSTWGSDKDLSTWDSPRVGHMAVAARRCELRTVAATAGHASPRAALERAARELLAVQASDWAFMATRELAGDYPGERLDAHGAELEAALGALGEGPADEGPAKPDRSSEAGGRAVPSERGAGGPADVISRAVPEPSVRNLAPDLDIAALTSP